MAQVNKDHRDSYNRYQRERYKRIHWPKCKDCGYIARYFWDLGCLNCHATHQPRRDWTPEESDIIEIHAGKDDPANLQFRLFNETGIARSRDSIRAQIKAMGIKVTSHQDGYTIPQLVTITGRPYNTINNLIQDGLIKNIGKGRRILVSPEDGEMVIARYKRTERPSYTYEEAAMVLGYDPGSIRSAVKRGLPSWKEGGHTRRVCKVTIDRAAEYLKTTGKIRVPWSRLIQ